MARNKKRRTISVKKVGSTAIVSATDARESFGFLVDTLLQEFEQILIERNGRPIAVLRPVTKEIFEDRAVEIVEY